MVRRTVLSLHSLILWTGLLMAQNAPIPVSSTGMDIIHYKINLELDWAKKKARIEAGISLVFTRAAQTIELAANDLLIYSIEASDKKQIEFRNDTIANRLHLSFDKIYKAGDKLTFTVRYETQHVNEPDPNAPGGSFGKGIRFFQPTQTNPIKRKQVWSQSELLYTSYWLPCTQDISDLSTTEITGKLDKGLRFISNGDLLHQKENADGSVSFYYKTTIPYPIYLAAFAAGEYKELVQEINGKKLLTYCYPDEEEAATATTKSLPGMLHFLENKTGFAYPYKQYSQVMVQDYPFPGLTGQNGMGVISDNMIDDYGTHKDFLYLWDGVEFNALASQWFGNTIIPKTIDDSWLAKGLAQYFEGLYTIRENGMDEYLLWYHPWESANAMSELGFAKYGSALILRVLQKELGEPVFLRSLQYFIKQNAFKPTTTTNFLNAITHVTGKNFKWFFDQWFHKTRHPVFQFTHEYDTKKKQLYVKIKQVQQTDSAGNYLHPTYFKGRIEIEIDDSSLVLELLPKEENLFSIALPAKPKLLNLDPDNIWIREVQTEKTRAEWLYQFLHSSHALSRNSAMNELVGIAKNQNSTAAEKNEIIHAFQTAISGNSYWRFRFNAIGQLKSIQSLPYDHTTIALLTSLVKKEKSWVKAAAIGSLGMTNDSAYADLYINCFSDTSDRVINSAAIALGKTRSSKAFEALVKLKTKPSWKSQSLMHSLGGLAQLKDPRGEDIALAALKDNRSPRWFLGNSWDYPFVAVQTLATLEKTGKACAILLDRFNLAMRENNTDDIFQQVLLIATLGNPKGLEIFERLKTKYYKDANAMSAIEAYEDQLKPATINK